MKRDIALRLVGILSMAGLAMITLPQGLPASAQTVALYVSPTGSDSTGAGSASSPYATVGHALAMAAFGSTVVLEPGTYKEMVVIGTAVTLESDSTKPNAAATTIIDGTGSTNGILIKGPGADGTVINGLTVENATQEGILAIGTTNVTVENNIVTGNATSVKPSQVAGPHTVYEAIHLMSVTNSMVANNMVVKNHDGGIYLTNELGQTTGNEVLDNTVSDNGVDCGITLADHVGTNSGIAYNLISGNTVDRNGASGILLVTPVPGGQVHDNVIIGNTSTNNGHAGVVILGHAPGDNMSNNQIVNNTVAGNAAHPDTGVTQSEGIVVFDPASPIDGTTIIGNTITNEYYGIFMVNATNALVVDNTVTGATTAIQGYTSPAPVGNVRFTCAAPGGQLCPS